MRFALLLALVMMAGCFGSAPRAVTPTCPLGDGPVTGIPFDVVSREASLTDPRQPWDGLVFMAGGANGSFSVEDRAGWAASATALSNGTGPHLARVRLQGGAGAGDSAAVLQWSVGGVNACSAETGLRAKLDSPRPGNVAQAGKAVKAYTAGFWENGTLFYTNMESVDASPWPRAGWYAWEGSDALPVYVYDRDSAEEGPQWSGCTPRDPAPRQCAPGYGSYFPTIEGFNEALKGLSTTTSRVVWMPPEKAYTRAGAEDHPLYGDALVFYIQIRTVEDVPCPAGLPSALCDLPGQ